MRCPTCNVNNPPTATSCSGCQGALTPRRPRRRNSEVAAPSPETEEYNRQVKDAFRVCLASAIPFFGLVLGPIGAFRAWRVLARGKGDPAFQSQPSARAAVMLGVLTGVTNWAGLALMAAGLMRA